MHRFKLLFLMVIMLMQILFSARTLDFTKNRNYGFGSGEYGKIQLDLKKFETYNFQSEVKPPFVMKHVKNGLIELIYDTRMPGFNLEVGKTYRKSFVFTKKNIGKKEKLNISATYEPEIRFNVNDTLFTDFVDIVLTPDNTTETILLKSLKNFGSRFEIDMPENIISFSSDTDLKFEKGLNSLELKLLRHENFQKEIVLFRTVNGSRINQLYIYLTSEGFKQVAEEKTNPENSAMQDSIILNESDINYDDGMYSGDIENDQTTKSEQSSSGFSFFSLIIIIVMGIIIIILLIMLLASKKGALYEKFETFFDDVATLVKVNPKGNNLDRSIEEIMMILLEKFEFSQQEETKKKETKKILKRPDNLKSSGLNKQTSNPKVENDPEKSKSDKKVTRGFDFLDEEN